MSSDNHTNVVASVSKIVTSGVSVDVTRSEVLMPDQIFITENEIRLDYISMNGTTALKPVFFTLAADKKKTRAL